LASGVENHHLADFGDSDGFSVLNENPQSNYCDFIWFFWFILVEE